MTFQQYLERKLTLVPPVYRVGLYRPTLQIVKALVSRSKGGQATKGLWWMSWRQGAMKDVAWLR
jgi:hypothetical protein